jgi:hypothetical protein
LIATGVIPRGVEKLVEYCVDHAPERYTGSVAQGLPPHPSYGRPIRHHSWHYAHPEWDGSLRRDREDKR